jgi:hypothetical protein
MGLAALMAVGGLQSLVAAPATFNLSEQFGVAWPEQPIEFRYDGGQPPANTRMIGPLGAEVPFQWVSSCSDTSAVKGCIAVRSDLPANKNYVWTLQQGAAPAARQVNAVQLKQVGNNYEITNGLTGVRIVAPSGNPAPFNRAPIQGILLPGGVWSGSAAGSNLLYAEPVGLTGCIGCLLQTPMYTVTGYTVKVVDAGPMKTVLQASYTFNRPRFAYGPVGINTAGAGHYTFTVTMYANSKAAVIDEDSDMQFSYYIPVYKELTPNQARYRGHDGIDSTGTYNPVCGYETPTAVTGATNASPIVITTTPSIGNGQRVSIGGVQGNVAANGTFYAKTAGYPAGHFALYQDAALTKSVPGSGNYAGGGTVEGAYRGQNLKPTVDAFLNVTYTGDRSATYLCDEFHYRKLIVNYPSATHSSGWYVELYNSARGAASPIVGIFTGRASQQQFSARGSSMPGIYSSNRHWISKAQDAGIQVDNLLRGPDGSTTTMVHRNWGLFIGSASTDLLPAAAHQPISTEQNSLTGINLSHIYTYSLSYADPAGGWKWLYLSPQGANQLVSEVRDGTSICGSPNCYYNLLKNSEGSIYGDALLDMWQGNSTAAVQGALDVVTPIATQITLTLAQGDNHYGNQLGYYQLGFASSPATSVLNAILMDPNANPAQKSVAKAELALFGCLLWDNDWFSIDNTSGESVGLANQIEQYLEYRTQSATADPSQPFLATKLNQAAAYPAAGFDGYFSDTGAAAGSTHYQSAFFEPLMMNYQSLATDGLLSFTDPKWAAYARWELSIQTPPEPRFGNVRKGYSNGDGNTEADVRTGMLGTAMNATNPALASNLMWAWQQSNSPTHLTEDSQYGTTVVTIDPSIKPVAPDLKSINIPGYHAAERHGFGTPNETAVWFIDGGFYSSGGHRHYDDGQVSIYADSAPLAIDWNANLYSPQTPGRFMHNSVVFDNEMGHAWNADNPGTWDVATLMQNPTNTEFDAFASSTHAGATFTAQDGTVWTRRVRTMAFNPKYPIIYVTDSFAGPSAGMGKTVTWNLMAAGPVATPAGQVNPVTRFSPGCQTVAAQLPSSGNVYSLNAGLQRFSFTGVPWPKHPGGGINWDLFTVPSGGTGQFLLGNWGHGCHPVRESQEFAAANGAPFAETQHILRIHDSAPFITILMPYAKNATPTRTVTQQACGVRIVQGAETTCFSGSAAQYTNGTTTSILSVYDGSTQAAFGVTATGGPQEVTLQGNQIVWTISGISSGNRSVTLAGNWTSNNPQVTKNGNTFSYNFSGGAQTQPITISFTAH